MCACRSLLCVLMSSDLLAFSFVGDRRLSGARQASYPHFPIFCMGPSQAFLHLLCYLFRVWFLDLILCFCLSMVGLFRVERQHILAQDGIADIFLLPPIMVAYCWIVCK